jgi:hypothetical protein
MMIAKKRLALIWLAGAGVLFAIMFVQTLLGKYGQNTEAAWSWLLPTILPTASLVVGVLVTEAVGVARRPVEVNPFVYRLAAGLSIVYLSAVLLTLLAIPFSDYSPIDVMRKANLGLGPFQGLVTAAMGAFFVYKQKVQPAAEPATP